MTEIEFNRRMDIESQMAADRERAAADKVREAERNDPKRRNKEVEVGGGSAVRRPVIKGNKRIGGVTASSSSRPGTNGSSGGGSVVKKPVIPRRPGRQF